MSLIDEVAALGKQWSKPREVKFKLDRDDYNKLCDLGYLSGVSFDCFVRGIILRFLNDVLVEGASLPDQEVKE